MEEWKIYRLGDLVDFQNGYAFKSSKFLYDGKYKIIRIKELKNGLVKFFEDTVSISDEPNEILSKILVNKGDVIFALTGDPVSKQNANSWVGRVSLYTHDIPAYLNQRTCKIIQCNNVVPQYVYYYFRQYENLYSLASKATGSASQANISTKILEDTEILLPSLSVQKKMVAILASLDNKIALNRRINDNLEQQAQALFKAWFVDFEPFKGEKFVESQLGMIPEGWKVGTLSDLLDIRYGKDHKKLNDGNIPVYGSGGVMRLADGILYNGESVLIPRKGTLNNVLYVNCPFWTVDTMFYSIEKVPNVAKYCHLLLSKLDLASMNSGSAVPSMTTDILNKIQVIVANQDVFRSFNECISSLYLKAKINLDENKQLSETRDLLLPKLMSGGLIIKDLHS
ncbi:restriction endonuclease subunit S [Phocaeicola dorei]|nr:restriction endonuclease subunit S [Phocaeicola dorei]